MKIKQMPDFCLFDDGDHNRQGKIVNEKSFHVDRPKDEHGKSGYGVQFTSFGLVCKSGLQSIFRHF